MGGIRGGTGGNGVQLAPPRGSVRDPFAHMVALPGERLRAFNKRVRAELKRAREELRADVAAVPLRKVSKKRKAFLARSGGEGGDSGGDETGVGADADLRPRARAGAVDEFQPAERVGFLERAEEPPKLSSRPVALPARPKLVSGTGKKRRREGPGDDEGAPALVKGAWSPEAITAAAAAAAAASASAAAEFESAALSSTPSSGFAVPAEGAAQSLAARARQRAHEEGQAAAERAEQLRLAQIERAADASRAAYAAMRDRRRDAFAAAKAAASAEGGGGSATLLARPAKRLDSIPVV